ncbi:N-acetylneuraminate synthase [Citrobacter amalonaticus]|uniref:N-acetylneuraminate synthase n=1 Tax=Citrobacter amalonaticus TaxID=35703 RepID=UPI00200A4D6B|nr:N-acetylneuraminate synthase [Citrobacter amalonaticus]MCK8152294.1 N-acetylneuraminate synthase [Citrobacter amalonaticus]
MAYIIAEAGVNHNGSEELAMRLIDEAYKAGADAVKFQTFKAEKSIAIHAEQADYQVVNTGKKESQLEMVKRLELSYEAHHRLFDYCKNKGIEFLSTAFDSESLDFLVKDLGINTLKIASGELTNAPFILKNAQTGCNLIVSTGMATLGEIEKALGVIAFGLMNTSASDIEISEDLFLQAYSSAQGQTLLREKVKILHCTTEYPAPFEDINLMSMNTMDKAFGLPVGYSDHSKGISVPIAAVALGACIIEKHFTLDKTMEGPDHKASLEPTELTEMVKAIREVELAMGNGLKMPQQSEIKNKLIARKSLVAACAIKEGTLLKPEHFAVKRPGTGLSPYDYWKLLGTKASKNYAPDELIFE